MKPYEKLRAAIAESLNAEAGKTLGPFSIASDEVIALELALTEALPHLLTVTRVRWGQVRMVVEDGRVTYVLPEFSHKVKWR